MLNVSKRTAYMILAISIVVEVIGDAMLTASHGYDHALLGIAAIIAIVFSFFLFSKILHIIDLPIAYATLVRSRDTGVHTVGRLFLSPAPFAIGWISIIILAAATFTMNMWGTPAEDPENAETESRETAENTNDANREENGSC